MKFQAAMLNHIRDLNFSPSVMSKWVAGIVQFNASFKENERKELSQVDPSYQKKKKVKWTQRL